MGASRINLAIEMINHRSYCHYYQKNDQWNQVHRNKINHQHNRQGLQQTFDRVVGKRGLGGSHQALMVCSMDPAIHRWQMHPTMQPIIISLMQYQKDQYTSDHPTPMIVRYFIINGCLAKLPCMQYPGSQDTEEKGGYQGVQYLWFNLAFLTDSGIYSIWSKLCSIPDIKKIIKQTRHQHVTNKYGSGQHDHSYTEGYPLALGQINHSLDFQVFQNYNLPMIGRGLNSICDHLLILNKQAGKPKKYDL